MVLALQPSAAIKPASCAQQSPQPPPQSAESAQQPVSSLELPPLITGASFSSPVLHDPLSPTYREAFTAPAVEISTLERQLTASTATPAKLSPADDAEPGLDLRAPRPSSGMDALRRLAEGDCLDSESDDGDWEIRPPAPRPEGEEAPGASDDEFSFPMRHCINCTNKMPEDVPVCDECGHDMATDAVLVTADAPALADDAEEPSRGNQSNVTVLCYDERMTEHEEGKPNPHPERPDRIRAVMARLKRQGVLGTMVLLATRATHTAQIEWSCCRAVKPHGRRSPRATCPSWWMPSSSGRCTLPTQTRRSRPPTSRQTPTSTHTPTSAPSAWCRFAALDEPTCQCLHASSPGCLLVAA